jgi:acetyl-CoA carboxylase biotin carboxyl carrier protein
MQNIKLEDILKIIEQFETSSIDSLRYKTGEEEIELSRNKNGSTGPPGLQNMNAEQVNALFKEAGEKGQQTHTASAGENQSTEQQKEKEKEQAAEEENNLFTVTSPIIGTFYRSPAPGKSPYVNKGDKTKKGDILCVIEAMKVMNKIESEVSGEIVEEIAEDGQTVEYGSELFKIRLD